MLKSPITLTAFALGAQTENRACKREQFLSLGKDILEKLFKQENLEFNEKAVYATLPHFESESLEDLYAKVGEGDKSNKT